MDNKTLLILLISIAAAVLIITALVLVFTLRGKRFSSLNELKDQYNQSHTILTIDCLASLDRLEVLSHTSDEYDLAYKERNKQYKELLERRDLPLLDSLQSLEALRATKSYKQCKELEIEIRGNLESFSKAVNNFSEDLSTILSKDVSLSTSLVVSKTKRRQIQDFYNEHQNELRSIQESFDTILNESEDSFKKVEFHMNEAKYDQAKEILDETDALLSATISVMDQLPLLLVSLKVVLPTKINKLVEEYNIMVQDGFYIDDLEIPDKVDSMRDVLQTLLDKLVYFDISGISEKIDEIQSNIADLLVSLNKEKDAKEQFLNSQSILEESTFSLERDYSRQTMLLSDYKAIYQLDRRKVDEILSLKSDIENIGILKRELDSYLDTTDKKPYTLIVKKINDMNEEMTKVNKTMSNYQSYLDELKSSVERVHSGLRECFLSLLDSKNRLIASKVDSYDKATEPKFNGYLEKASSIDRDLLQTPIDVDDVTNRYKMFESECKAFVGDVNKTLDLASKAESNIVYANRFRDDYVDCNNLLQKAEAAYDKADFERSISFSEKALATFKDILNNR